MSSEHDTDLKFYIPMDINTAASVDNVNRVSAIVGRCPKKKDIYLNKCNEEGWTPLMYAAQNGNKRVLLYLLKAGALASVQNRKGQNALMLAASYGHKESVEILVQRGVDLNATDFKCWTPLFHATSAGQHLIVQFLLKNKCLMNLRDSSYGMTPLMIAAIAGHEMIVIDLFQFGADPFFRSKDDFTARDLAIQYKNNKVVDAIDSYLNSSRYRSIDGEVQDAIMRSSTVQEILKCLDLSKYCSIFIDQGIDLDKFWTLTDKNLMDMGIKLLGPRRKITYTISKWQEWMVYTKHSAQSSNDKLSHEMLEREFMNLLINPGIL